MPPPLGSGPDSNDGRPVETTTTRSQQAQAQQGDPSVYKPPLPTLPTRSTLGQQPRTIEVQLAPLIAGALVSAFATAVADSLGNALLTHYYFPDEQRVRLNLDRVVDRLIANFNSLVWDELFTFYDSLDDVQPRQVKLLFDGPIRQIILVLNGPETAQCVLDRIGPGLSRRPATWSTHARGIDLALALQLLCSYWHREYSSRSPGGNPDEIARVLHSKIMNSRAAMVLVAGIQKVLLSPHYVQMHLMESAVWQIVTRRQPSSAPPPVDGFHVLQFKFECQLFGPHDAISDPQLVRIGSLPALTGTASECVGTTISDYVSRRWPRLGHLVLRCLEDAVRSASQACQQGDSFWGMAVWDGADDNGESYAGLRLIHVEVEDAAIRLSVSAWTHTLIEVLQQMAWTCAALSASPFPGALSECVVEVADWDYLVDSVYVSCSLAHHPVAEGEGLPWVQQRRGAAIARGFPVDDFVEQDTGS